MAKRVPTSRGDVLVLHSESIPTYAIGIVSQDGQQDFHRTTNVRYLIDRIAALAEARARIEPGGGFSG